MDEKQTYSIFDGDEEQFQTVVETNANIRSVCRIITQAQFLSDEERIYYAEQGDIPPVEGKEDQLLYNFDNIYLPGQYWPAIAQVLFYGVDEMVKVKKGVAKIVDREKADSLNRAVVKEALTDFFFRCGITPHELRSSLSLLGSDRILEIIQKFRQGTPPEELPPLQPTANPGETKS